MKYMLAMSIISAILLLWDIFYSLKRHSQKFLTKRKERVQRQKSLKFEPPPGEKNYPVTLDQSRMDFNLDQLSPVGDEKELLKTA